MIEEIRTPPESGWLLRPGDFAKLRNRPGERLRVFDLALSAEPQMALCGLADASGGRGEKDLRWVPLDCLELAERPARDAAARVGDVVREGPGGLELRVFRVDDSVEPAAAWCGFPGHPEPWGCRWVAADQLTVVRRADGAGPRDEVAAGMVAAAEAALDRGEAVMAGVLERMMALRAGGLEAEALAALMGVGSGA